MSRLLIECTYVFEHPNDNSGIQRVVRNIIGQLGKVTSEIECIPVILYRGQVYRVISLRPVSRTDTFPYLSQLHSRARAFHHRYWTKHAQLEQRWPMNSSHSARRVLYVLAKLLGLTIETILNLTDFARTDAPPKNRAVPFSPEAGDQLLMLDSSWHADLFPLAEKLKRQGVGIISVIYDLIPITHPQFCDAGLVVVFHNWFNWISKIADGFICISSTIQKQVEAEVTDRLGKDEASERWFDHFYLGSELDLVKQLEQLDAALVNAFSDHMPTYLMVSTIEPRKNHSYLLDAFDLLWKNNVPVRLCIIGKIGWKCEALIARIKKHPEFNKKLFMFNKLDDNGLQYAYQHAKALVFPSFVEGFGLPIVEAMQRHLPVMASDIPVFKEIGSEFIAYFNLSDPNSLADLVKRYETDNLFPAEKPMTDWNWILWQESAQQLIDRTNSHITNQNQCIGLNSDTHAHSL